LAAGRFLRGLGGLAAELGGPFFGLRDIAIIDGDIVATLLLEVSRHGVAHDAETQKRNLRHREFS
jgi:hypothetical protein